MCGGGGVDGVSGVGDVVGVCGVVGVGDVVGVCGVVGAGDVGWRWWRIMVKMVVDVGNAWWWYRGVYGGCTLLLCLVEYCVRIVDGCCIVVIQVLWILLLKE